MHAAKKKIFKAMGALSSVQALGMLCSLVRNKLIAVWIGPVGVGLVTLYNSVSDLVGVSVRLNFDQSSVREIAAARDETARVAHTVHVWSVTMGVVSWLLMCMAAPLLSRWSFGDRSHWPDFCLLGSVPFFISVALGYQAVMKGMRQFGRLARVNFIVAIGGIAVAVPLIWWLRVDSIIWVIVVYSGFLYLGSYLWRVRLPSVRMSAGEVWRTGSSFVWLGASITAGVAMTALCNYLFVLFMNNSADTGALGFYQAGYTIINTYVGVLFAGVWVEYFPRLSASVHSRRATAVNVSHRISVTTWMLLPVTGLFMACDELIVRVIYSRDFLPMVPFITFGMAAMVLRSASWCIQHTVLARGDGKFYLLSEAASCVLCLVLNIFCYLRWGFLGLGVSYIVWYGAYLGLVWWIYRSVYGYRLRGRVMTAVMAVTAFAIAAAVARLTFGWQLPLLMGIATIPIAWRQLKK